MRFFSLFSLAATASAKVATYESSEAGFSQWMADNKKDYHGAEVFKRYHIWMENYARVEEHNAEYEKGMHGFYLGMTSLADMTNEEYRATMLGKRPSARGNAAIGTFEAPKNFVVPDSVDWRTHTPKVVSPIKDQGQCGSCWAFSAVEAMEAVAAMHEGKAVTKGAPQQLVDCVNNGADNCNQGGEMHDGYLEVMKEGGLDTELSYPYQATSGHACRFKKDSIVPGTDSFKGYKNVTSGNETSLEAAVAVIPTVSIGIDASEFKFQMYSGGVYNNPLCHNKMNLLDHGVAVVGYGKEGAKPYWLVRNSWGTVWGLEGYIMMTKDKNNQCGVATDATYPVY